MDILSPSPIDQLCQKTKIPYAWFVILSGLLLLMLPILVVLLEGIWQEFIYEGAWRTLLLAPAIVFYIIALIRPMNLSLERALRALMEVIQVDEDEFIRIVKKAYDVDNRLELAAFAFGAAFGLLVATNWTIEERYSLLRIYLPIANAVMFGSISWIAVSALASTRLQTELHKLPMQIDLFNLKPFEPIGRHSLFTALAFIGGCVISVIHLTPVSNAWNIYNLLVYGTLISIVVLLFFLTMRHTHRKLAEKKASELLNARKNISSCFQALQTRSESNQDVREISTELDLWTKYELRLKDARTWPYNTAMLRTLFLSVLLPAIASLAQRIFSSLLMN
jgi:hypothetical protein